MIISVLYFHTRSRQAGLVSLFVPYYCSNLSRLLFVVSTDFKSLFSVLSGFFTFKVNDINNVLN
jgi:hypothetical protein